MPSNILIIENDVNLIANYELILNSNLKIQHTIVNSFDNFTELLNTQKFTHLIVNSSVSNSWFAQFRNLIDIPTLVISNDLFQHTPYKTSDIDLTYDKIISFISETSSFSFNTLNEYALGEEDILNELKKQIQEEFKENFDELPQLIIDKNLTEIKSKVHQISSKFSLLEMNDTYKISKEIDINILEDSENQLINCQNLLVDIAVVLDQVKN